MTLISQQYPTLFTTLLYNRTCERVYAVND